MANNEDEYDGAHDGAAVARAVGFQPHRLRPPQFDGDDFDEWSFRFRSYLAATGLAGVIDFDDDDDDDDVDEHSDVAVYQLLASVCSGTASRTLRLGMRRAGADHAYSGRFAWAVLMEEYAAASDEEVSATNTAILTQEFTTLSDYSDFILGQVDRLRATGNPIALSDQAIRTRVLGLLPDEYAPVVYQQARLHDESIDELFGQLKSYARTRNFLKKEQYTDGLETIMSVSEDCRPRAGRGRGGGSGSGSGGGGQHNDSDDEFECCCFCQRSGHQQIDCPRYQAAKARYKAQQLEAGYINYVC